MGDVFGLLLLIAMVASVFWLGFRLGYRYRDNLSLERQKKYRGSKSKIATASVETASAAESQNQASG
ncbi:MAG: hypothetical protein KGL11_05210 [Alphaproteobacteria bacterium]|nr:hypothetical protein [Alphaproteobacteria bacterium]